MGGVTREPVASWLRPKPHTEAPAHTLCLYSSGRDRRQWARDPGVAGHTGLLSRHRRSSGSGRGFRRSPHNAGFKAASPPHPAPVSSTRPRRPVCTAGWESLGRELGNRRRGLSRGRGRLTWLHDGSERGRRSRGRGWLHTRPGELPKQGTEPGGAQPAPPRSCSSRATAGLEGRPGPGAGQRATRV